MKKFIVLFFLALAGISCSKDGLFSWGGQNRGEEEFSHDMIVLGEQLQDPYSVQNMTKALELVAPAGAGRTTLDPTDFYVRFLPSGEEQMQALTDAGLELLDHPLDYRIVKDGDWYHDPSVPEGDITWQYAVVPVGFEFPKGIRYERLDDCYIAEHDPATKADGIDWDAVEMEAFRLTGNMDLVSPATKDDEEANSGTPHGRIAIIDPEFDEEPIGVKGVKVSCNVFVKISSCYTDEEGYYKMNRQFNSKVRYRLVFKNVKGFCQGLNLILIPASMSTLGKQSPAGYSLVIDENSDRRLFMRCVVNNAGYDYFAAASANSIPCPPKDFRIWNLGFWDGEMPLFLHHGTIIETYDPISSAVGEYAPLIKILPPDVVLGQKVSQSYSEIYANALHAFAHGGHFSLAGKDWWGNYAEYMLKSLISSSEHNAHGSRGDDDYNYCEISEVFAYYCQSALYRMHYKESSAMFGTQYWFTPQLLMYMDERGLGLDKITALFTADVTDIETLHNKLLSYYPAFKAVINEAFVRYGNQ